MAVAGAEGSYLWDYDGNRYLDFSSQLVNVNIGHQHPKVVEAIREQAGRLSTIAPQHANDVRSEAARLIAEVAPDGLDKIFFTNGGADAIENAVRMARLHTGRHKVLTRLSQLSRQHDDGHPDDRRPAALAERRRRDGDRPLLRALPLPLAVLVDQPGAGVRARSRAPRAGRRVRGARRRSPRIVLESIPGTAGILVPPDGYLAGVREICDRAGIVYIADEVMSGFGRAGEWFAVDKWDVTPDLITFAKGSNSGYVPLGGVIISEPIAATFAERVFPGGLTYSGHPLACAAVVASITAFHDEGILDNARRMGDDVLGPGLREIAERHPSVGEVRGLGVFWALDLVKDKATREMLVPYNAAGAANKPMADLVAACKSRGLLPFVNFNRLHVVPPCTVSEAEAKEGLAILDEALTVADEPHRT